MIDLPDDLFRKANAVAALRGISLKDLISSCVESGLAPTVEVGTKGRIAVLPEFIARTGKPIASPSSEEIERILLIEDSDAKSIFLKSMQLPGFDVLHLRPELI